MYLTEQHYVYVYDHSNTIYHESFDYTRWKTQALPSFPSQSPFCFVKRFEFTLLRNSKY